MINYKNRLGKIVCYDCGLSTLCKVVDGTTMVFDSESGTWAKECPSCEGNDFYEDGTEYVNFAS